MEILEPATRKVVASSGAITARLREDWQLVDVMKELNWEKYKALNLTETIQDKDGRRIYKIKDWTKRNDIDTTRWTPSLSLLQNLLSFSF